MYGPYVVDVCSVCTALCIHVYMTTCVCTHYMCKCAIPGLTGKGRNKSLSLLCLLGSGLPSRAHRCMCVPVSVPFYEVTHLGAHCTPRDQGSPIPILHLFSCQPGRLGLCCPHPCSTLPVGGRPWGMGLPGPGSLVPGCLHHICPEPVFLGSLSRAPGSQLG